jgi:hypothetical protein
MFLICVLAGCNSQNRGGSTEPTSPENLSLPEKVKLAINPKFSHWVLFKNGTYIIIKDTSIKNDTAYSIEIMKTYGPVMPGSPSDDIGVMHLTKVAGWVVSYDHPAMHTYVGPEELENAGIKAPTDVDIGLWGRQKREKDAGACRIIYVSK